MAGIGIMAPRCIANKMIQERAVSLCFGLLLAPSRGILGFGRDALLFEHVVIPKPLHTFGRHAFLLLEHIVMLLFERQRAMGARCRWGGTR
ncbi:hypothetical protein [Mesorhizobium sp.]|uniref:hypothetical protein n=1 Tax=Mesorhizobium sp. TaxID=1871066 RepID=UPI00257EED70|nr:hypothetical protein [Mesorhizobium sp.]